jgi:hypothetical protein
MPRQIRVPPEMASDRIMLRTACRHKSGRMHVESALIVALCALVLRAQTSQDPEVARAQAELARTRSLVEAGVAAPVELDKARQMVADAEEHAQLRGTLYGHDVTEGEADEMVALAERRLERREQEVAKGRERVEQGVASAQSLAPFLEQADLARKEHDYAATRAKVIHEMAEMAREEAELEAKLASAPAEARSLAERYDGNGTFTTRDFKKVSRAFERTFSKGLPVSADGETAVHRALGFDHRGRVDVALNPDQPEGVWLRQYLAANHIPYFAFRGAVHGKATGPHIHIGPMSARLAHGG